MQGLAFNATQLVAELVETQQRLGDLEERLLHAGIVDEKTNPHYGILLGHRLERAEEAIAAIQGTQEGVLLPMDAAWVLSCATLVFLMQLGFAQLEVGMCRPKMSSQHTLRMLQICDGSLATLIVGYALAYGQVPLFDEIEAWKFFSTWSSRLQLRPSCPARWRAYQHSWVSHSDHFPLWDRLWCRSTSRGVLPHERLRSTVPRLCGLGRQHLLAARQLLLAPWCLALG